jgi:hypothetical protein
MRKGIGSHTLPNRGAKDEWLTPPSIIEKLGPFDLDPCAAVAQPWPTAARMLTIEDDGFSAAWEGFVWCNPPYGPETWKWLRRLAFHPEGGIALTFARTETEGFFDTCWAYASAMLFIRGRLYFHHATGERASGNAGGPSVLVAYGQKARERLANSGIAGAMWTA